MGRSGMGDRGTEGRRPSRVRGTVVRVLADKGFCFIEPENLPAGYRLEPGKGIFMHQSTNHGTLPAQGDAGEFEIAEGDRGLRVVRVAHWDTRVAPGPPRDKSPAAGTFVHPYNFVSLPTDGLEGAGRVEPFRRAESPPHGRYLSDRFSGWLQCELETKTWWFLPDPRKSAEESEHKILGYFTLDAVDERAWRRECQESPEADTTRPAIPASSLRGMVRSVFEAATLSCLSVFDRGVLDLRVGFDPASRPEDTPVGRQEPHYVPVRVVRRHEGGTVDVQVLDGRLPNDPDPTLPVALLDTYVPKVKYRNPGERSRWLVGSQARDFAPLATLKDGDPVAMVLPERPQRHSRRPFHYRQVAAAVSANNYDQLKVARGQVLIFGYLHRTGPNIENKHNERIFFRWAEYNQPDTNLTVEERYARFCADHEPSLAVEVAVVQAAEAGLRGYLERHEREVKRLSKRGIQPPRRIGDDAPFPSDFVDLERRQVVQEGDLLYALIEGEDTVRGLYPVALPRLSHEDSRGELLHRDFHPCDRPENLCPACRVFGWVRPQEGRLAPEPGRVDAVAGHVRFTHGTLEGEWGTEDRRPLLTTLAILGSPKPTTTAFYLRQRPNYEEARSGRWPPVLQTALHENIPLYRGDEAALRGRKLYRRRENVNPESHDPATGGICRPPEDDGRPKRDSQNQTVHLLPKGLKFAFRVYFDNLTSEALGALVFALSLQATEGWQAQPMRHSLGHGKPLGLGACEVSIDGLQVDVFDPKSAAHRYTRVTLTGKEEGLRGQQAGSQLALHLGAFARAWAQAEQNTPSLEKTRRHLLEMLRAQPPEGPVHYPPDPDGGEAENFKWFVHNRRAKASPREPRGRGQMLPTPLEEREEPATRLQRDPREGSAMSRR